LTTSTMSKARQNQLTTLVLDLPTMCASVYHQFLNPDGPRIIFPKSICQAVHILHTGDEVKHFPYLIIAQALFL